MSSERYRRISEIVLSEFSDIVDATKIFVSPEGKVSLKIRLFLIDNTIIDIRLSSSGKYSYHWEQRDVRDHVYRHDNTPHKRWASIKTYPKHYHDGSESNVKESYISDDYEEATREFMKFAREKLKEYIQSNKRESERLD